MKSKDLKNKYKDFTSTPIDIIRSIDPTNTGKYTDIIMSTIVKGVKNSNERGRSSNSRDIQRCLPDGMSGFNYIMLEILSDYITNSDGIEWVKWLHDFEKYSKSGHIEDKDIQNYKTFEDLMGAVITTKDKLAGKDSTPKYETVYSDDDGWLVIKPLNFRASRKYGSNTKWCTTMINNQSYFYEYAHRGVLLYLINSKTDIRWAVMYRQNKLLVNHYGPQDIISSELSWWDVKDKRRDSYFVNIPDEVMKVTMEHIVNETGSNSYYFDKDTLKEWRDWDSSRRDSESIDFLEEDDFIMMEEDVVLDEVVVGGTDMSYESMLNRHC